MELSSESRTRQPRECANRSPHDSIQETHGSLFWTVARVSAFELVGNRMPTMFSGCQRHFTDAFRLPSVAILPDHSVCHRVSSEFKSGANTLDLGVQRDPAGLPRTLYHPGTPETLGGAFGRSTKVYAAVVLD